MWWVDGDPQTRQRVQGDRFTEKLIFPSKEDKHAPLEMKLLDLKKA